MNVVSKCGLSKLVRRDKKHWTLWDVYFRDRLIETFQHMEAALTLHLELGRGGENV